MLAVLTAIIGPRLATAAKRDGVLPTVTFGWVGTVADRTAQVERFVDEWFGTCSPKKRAAARALVPTVVAAAHDGDVSPAIIAAIVSYESTWQPIAIGKLGEVGLMQVGHWTGAPLDTPRAQLDAGISILRHAYAVCSTVSGALSYYATGESCKEYRGARLRVRLAAHIESL